MSLTIHSPHSCLAHAVICTPPRHLSTPESIEPLISVTDKRQTHTGFLSTHGLVLRSQSRAVVRLWNLVNGEILRISGGLQLGLERRADATKLVPHHTTEEGVFLDFGRTAETTETIFWVADEAIKCVST